MDKITKKLIISDSPTNELLDKLKENKDVDPKFKQTKNEISIKNE